MATHVHLEGNERGEDSWCLQRVKNKITLGSLEESAFQLSLKWRDRPEDPLTVPLFSDLLPYHSLPHCGVYGPDDYYVAVPMAVIILPSENIISRGSIFSALPGDIQHYFRQKPVRDPRLLDAAVLVHSRPLFEGSLDPSAREVNLMFHMWAFQGVEFAEGKEAHITMEMGVFCPQGVCETRQNICEELNGIAVGRLGPRILYMHDMRLSPQNAQLATTENLSSFFAVGRQDNGRMVITYHILPNTEEMEAQLRGILASSNCLGDCLGNFEQLKHRPSVHIMRCLFTACVG